MSSLAIRRLIVWAVSMVLGAVVSWAIVTLVLPNLTADPTPISLADYGIQYFIVTFVPIGLIFVIWIDHFMDTRILPD